MRILGIDTTTKFLALAVYDRTGIAEYNIDLGRRHSALLAVSVERCLKSLNLSIRDIDFFAAGIGPGSFTGIRVGLSALKGFGFANRKPVVGVPTLDILAQGAADKDVKDILVLVDAKRGLLYAGSYRRTGKGLQKASAYRLVPPEGVKDLISPSSVVLGDGLGLYSKQIKQMAPGARILDSGHWYPKGRHIIELALKRIQAGKTENAGKLQPIYLYPKECQIRK